LNLKLFVPVLSVSFPAKISKLKIILLDFPHHSNAHSQVATQALDLGILLMVADGDLDAFAHNVDSSISGSVGISSGSSPRKRHILGLNLMNLLVDNRLLAFHAKLELLTEAEASNPFVSFPIITSNVS
jgi:26S proteasome regulatory subunit N12